MWDYCGYFGEAGDFCLRVLKENGRYFAETSDMRKEELYEGRLRCFSPYGVCVELRREGEKFRAYIYLLPEGRKVKEVER